MENSRGCHLKIGLHLPIYFITNSLDYIYYKKEKWELANKDEKDKDTFNTNLKDKIFLVKDKGNFTYNKLKATNSDKIASFTNFLLSIIL